MRTRPSVVLALAAASCVDFADLPDGDYAYIGEELVDPSGAVASADGLYVPMPHAGDVAQVKPSADDATVQFLAPADIVRLEGSDDGSVVLAVSDAVRCDTEEAVFRDLVAECPSDQREDLRFVDVLAPADATTRFEVNPGFGRFRFSADGRFAVASLDPDADVQGGGLVSLSSLLVLDLQQGSDWEVPVGFAADRLLFQEDAEGTTVGMVVLSQSEVVTVDLAGAVPTPGTTYPLALDADTVVAPDDVALTPGAAYALITVQGSADLYALDLGNPSINIVSLRGVPSKLVVDEEHDRTFIAYQNRAIIDVLDHQLFDLVSIDVDEPADEAVVKDDYALFWSQGSGRRDVVRLDLDTLRVDEYRLNFAPGELQVSPDGSFALSFSGSGNTARMEVLDLRAVDGDVDDDPKPFGLDGGLADLVFSPQEDGSTKALLLLDTVDTLFELDWPSLQVETVDLPSNPVAIGALPDGPFWITHTDVLGLVSFYEPGEAVTTVGGFGRVGIHSERTLLVEGEE